MENTLVWQLLQSFSVGELREAGEFLQSPLMNKREDLKIIHSILSKAIKKGKAALTKEAVFKEAFPNQNFNDQQFRLSLSYLYKVLEEYLLWKELKNNPIKRPAMLLSSYRKKRLPAHFQKTLNKAEKQMQQQLLNHPEAYLEKYFIEQERYLFLSESSRTKTLNLQEVEDNLTTAFLAMKLRQACFLRSHEVVFNTIYHTALIEEILEETAQAKYEENIGVSLYRSCYTALFRQHGEKEFEHFKTLLFSSVGKLPEEDMMDLYLLAINYCIKKVNEGKHEFYRQALELYKNGLQTNLLLKEGRLSHFTYNNIVAVAIRLEDEWEWADWFVNHYRESLEPQFQEATFGLNAAQLAFVKKEYDKALIFLQKADYKDLINNMVAKVLQMKIYFEMEEYDLLDSHLRTMRMFIRRNKKMAYHRGNWTNIVRYTQKIMELNPFDEERKKLLKAQIVAEEALTEKEWLLGQLGVA